MLIEIKNQKNMARLVELVPLAVRAPGAFDLERARNVLEKTVHLDIELDEEFLRILPHFTGLLHIKANIRGPLPDNWAEKLPVKYLTLAYHGPEGHLCTALPEGLIGLALDGRNIDNLPELPASLRTLNCENTRLVELPKLPRGLKYLQVPNNRINKLGELPADLRELNCSGNRELCSLPEELPKGLVELDISNTGITKIGELPATLEYFNCSANRSVSELPKLPRELKKLVCWGTGISELPELPKGLSWLDCRNNRLSVLPSLPSSLVALFCSNNLLAECPDVPETVACFDGQCNPFAGKGGQGQGLSHYGWAMDLPGCSYMAFGDEAPSAQTISSF